ncbi:hypothetical protein FA15DRAFT_694874, partial [Coprinopsis marcescibilis]
MLGSSSNGMPKRTAAQLKLDNFTCGQRRYNTTAICKFSLASIESATVQSLWRYEAICACLNVKLLAPGSSSLAGPRFATAPIFFARRVTDIYQSTMGSGPEIPYPPEPSIVTNIPIHFTLTYPLQQFSRPYTDVQTILCDLGFSCGACPTLKDAKRNARTVPSNIKGSIYTLVLRNSSDRSR